MLTSPFKEISIISEAKMLATNIEVLIYRDGSNNKEEITEYPHPCPNKPNITIYTLPTPQFDHYNTAKAKLFRIRPGGSLEEIRTSFTNIEKDFSQPQTLYEFLSWALAKHYDPNQYYIILLMSDHGQSWAGFGKDWNNKTRDPIMLPLPGIRSAIQNALKETNTPMFDLIIFEACVMSSIEVIHELWNLTRYIIAPEAPLPYDGYAYATGRAIRAIMNDPTATVERFIDSFYESFRSFYSASHFEKVYKRNGIFGYVLSLSQNLSETFYPPPPGGPTPIDEQYVIEKIDEATLTIISTEDYSQLFDRINRPFW